MKNKELKIPGLKRQEVNLEIVDIPREVDFTTLFESVKDIPYSCLLDSSLENKRLGTHSFFGFEPFLILKARKGRVTFHWRGGEKIEIEANPFEALRFALNSKVLKENLRDFPPFLSGGIGYFAYELGRYIERLPSSTICDLRLPELLFCFFDMVVAEDHFSGERYLAVTVGEGENPREKISYALGKLKKSRSIPKSQEKRTREKSEVDFECGFTRDEYIEAVKKVKEYILAGDIYQANLSQRFSAPMPADPWSIYIGLRSINPAPFSAFLDFGDFHVLSSSPERFLRVSGREVETRPIKGTRPRSSDPKRDLELKRELLASTKDHAELSMIVDLERNDLGRVCQYGSVKVSEHAVIESYATVHHLVSTVTGVLCEDKDMVDLLKATFPGGSITGAPKIRAMEIIDELEPTERSVYTGSIGYLGFGGEHDLNIAIRTMISARGKIYFQVGGGIVADSDPLMEYEETLDKGRALFASIMDQKEKILAEIKAR